MKTPDISYFRTDLFTRFVPNTKAGETAYAEIARVNEGVAAVLVCHEATTLHQLRAAGYTVSKHRAAKFSDIADDELLAELAGL